MEFIVHTLNWTKGELFEAAIITIAGVLIIIAAVAFWKFGSTANARALVIPLLVVGVLSTATGASMVYSNQKRLVEFKQAFRQNPLEFVQQEKQRVEGFQYMYTVAQTMATVFFVLAVVFLWFTSNRYLHATAIALLLFGLSTLTIDYFSKERANTYYEIVLKELG